jgi:RND family efflux transporter MFP subunit
MTDKVDTEKTSVNVGTQTNEKWWKNKNAQTAGIIIGFIFLAGLFVWAFNFFPYVSTDDAAIDADVVRVSNQGAGYLVTKIYIKEGDTVKKGDILLELDHRTAQAMLEKAQARASFTAVDYGRAKAVASEHGISRQQLDRSGQDALTSHADLELAQIALEDTYIKSPVDGVILQKTAVEGNVLDGGQAAVTIADTDSSWISANVQEKEINYVRPGQQVFITVDSGGSLTGKVMDVRKAAASVFSYIPADNASGNFVKVEQRIPVRIQLDPHAGKTLRLGQSVEIKIKVR